MRTSCARGGATSTSSSLSSSPAAQQTAALHVMGFPAVSDMVGSEEESCVRFLERNESSSSRRRRYTRGAPGAPVYHLIDPNLTHSRP